MNASGSQKKCPYCAEMINKEAIKCRYCGTWLDKKRYVAEWTRSRKHAKLLGVCAGLARVFGISVTFVRVAFIIMTISGYGVLIYLILALLMPKEPEDETIRI